MDEDDLVVIVVGEEGEKSEPGSFPMPIKTEPGVFDEGDVSKIIETAIRHGQPVSVKEEITAGTDETYEYIEEYFDGNDQLQPLKPLHTEISCEDVEVEFQIEGNDDDNDQTLMYIKEDHEEFNEEELADDPADEDYVPDEDNVLDEDDVPDEGNVPRGLKFKSDSESEVEAPRCRRAPVTAAQRKSFVEDLKQQYPELRHNSKALVRTLAEIMRNIKRPPPPQDFFVMTDIMFECRKCGSMAETREAATRHHQEKHGPRYLVCFACGVDFRSTTNLYKHEKRCIAPDSITVLKARALSLGRKGRGRPFIPKLKDILERPPLPSKKFACSECPAVFTSKINLDSHENLHKGIRPYRCHQCSYAYTSYARLTRHIKHQHSGIEYICDHCGRTFKVKAALVVHLNTHDVVPKFQCEECPKRYANKAALSHHVRCVHRQLAPSCVCPICPKSYNRMALVRDHMKRDHGMSLMTRRMFFKALPKLTDEQLQQAKVILKSEKTNYILP